jgi:hypothetical protein
MRAHELWVLIHLTIEALGIVAVRGARWTKVRHSFEFPKEAR